jgi:DNA primase
LHPDPIARNDYALAAAEMIGVAPDDVQRELAQSRPATYDDSSEAVSRPRPALGHVKLEREALQLMLHDEAAVRWANELDEHDFSSKPRRELFARIVRALREERGLHPANLQEGLSEDGVNLLTELAVEPPPERVDDREGFTREVFLRIKIFSLDRDIKERRGVLQELNPLEEPERHDELFTQLVRLEARRRDLLKRLQEAA